MNFDGHNLSPAARKIAEDISNACSQAINEAAKASNPDFEKLWENMQQDPEAKQIGFMKEIFRIWWLEAFRNGYQKALMAGLEKMGSAG